MVKKFKKITSLMLASVMICANCASPVFAANVISLDDSIQVVESQDDISVSESHSEQNEPTIHVDSKSAETVGQDTGETPTTNNSSAVSIDDKSEQDSQHQKRTESFQDTVQIDAEDIADDIDFSSMRLIVSVKLDGDIIDPENVMSSYNGLYLMQYLSEEQAKNAYQYYLKNAEMVSVDASVNIADEGKEEITDEKNSKKENDNTQSIPAESDVYIIESEDGMTSLENPVSELSKRMESEISEQGEKTEELNLDGDIDISKDDELSDKEAEEEHPLIALIDTGIGEDKHVTDRVSMLGDDVDDDNGHGTRMLEYILEEDPDARVLSIKALDKDGRGTISSVYAAMEYAIAHNAKIINLSLYAYCTEENSALEEIVNRAVDQGITVVGAAGNDGKDVKYYTPGNIEKAVVVGACDDDGKKLPDSNFGETVDYYLVAGSTSEAAARAAGEMSAGKSLQNSIKESDNTNNETNINAENSSFNTAAKVSCIMNFQVYIMESDGTTKFFASTGTGSDAKHVNTEQDYSVSPQWILNTVGANISGYTLITSYFRGNLHWEIQNSTQGKIDQKNTSAGHNNGRYVLQNGNTSMTLRWTGDTSASGNWIRAYITRNTYYVRYNGNGSTGGSMANSSHTFGINSNLTGNAFTRTGYRFNGWSTNSNGTGTQLTDRQSIGGLAYSGTINIYAKWLANDYTVVYNGNGATGGSTANSSHKYGTAKNLTANGFTRHGYAFKGWATSAGGGVTYTNSESVLNLTSTHNGTYNLYAVWEKNTNILQTSHWLLNPDNASNGEAQYKLDSQDGTSPSVEVYRNHSAQNPRVSTYLYQRKYKTDEAKSLSPGPLDVPGTLEGEKITGTPTDILDKRAAMIPPNGTVLKTNATVVISNGVNPVPNTGIKHNTDYALGTEGKTMAPYDTELKFYYEPVIYNITYNLQDGVTNPNTATTYSVLKGVGLQDATRDGYEFKGWKDQNGAIYKNGNGPNYNPENSNYINSFADTDEIYDKLENRRTGDVQLTPIWKKITNGAFIDDRTSQLPALTETENNKGKFKIVEIKQTPGYVLDPDNPITETTDIINATINEDGILEMEIENEPNSFIIVKENEAGEKLAHAKFYVWQEGHENEKKLYETGDGKSEESKLGEIKVERCAPGYWYYQEIEAPPGYGIDTNIYPVYINQDGTVEGGDVRPAVVDPNSGTFIIKKVSETGEPMEDVEFEIKKDGTALTTTRVPSSSSMKIMTSTLADDDEEGWYQLLKGGRTIASGDVHDGEADVVVPDLEFGTYSLMVTTWEIGSDDDDFVAVDATITLSATQNVFRPDFLENRFNATVDDSLFNYTQRSVNHFTDANGEIRLSGLTAGTYTYKEISLPPAYADDYAMDEDTHTFVAEEVTEGGVTFVKTYVVDGGSRTESSVGTVINKRNHVTIKKVDASGNVIAGATVEIYKDGTLFDTVDIGTKEYRALENGTYTYKETKAPAGFKTDGTEKPLFTVTGGKIDGNLEATVSIENTPNNGELKKTDANGIAIQGAQIRVSSVSPAYDKTFTTDVNGKVYLEGLMPGTYEFKETLPGAGYLYSSEATGRFTVDASTGAYTYTYDQGGSALINYPNKARIKKVDPDGKVMSGVSFDIWKGDSKTKKYTLSFPGNVTAIRVDGHTQYENTALIARTFTDTTLAQTLSTTRTKTIDVEVPGTHTISVSYISNTTRTVTTTQTALSIPNLSTATAATARIVITTSSGNQTATFTARPASASSQTSVTRLTNGNGEISLTKLTPGTWHYQEISTKDGYVMDQSVHTFEVSDNGEISAGEGDTAMEEVLDDGTVQFTITNHKKATLTVVVNKNAIDKDGYSSPLASNNVVFKLYRVDGTTETEVGTLRNQGDGTYKVTGIEISPTARQTYKVVETSTEPGYICDFEKTFTVEPAVDAVVTETMSADNESNGFEFVKVDDLDRTIPLSNVKFKLSKVQGEFTFTYENEDLKLSNTKTAVANKYGTDANGILITDYDGRIELSNIESGYYELIETESRPEYEFDERAFYFYVDENGFMTDYAVDDEGNVTKGEHVEVKTIETSTTNTPHIPDPHGLTIKKIGARGESFEGASFKLQEWNGTKYVDVDNPIFDNGNGTYSARDTIERNNKTNKGRFKIVETEAPPGHACDYEQLILVREKNDILTKKDKAYLKYAQDNNIEVLDIGALDDNKVIELEAHDTPVTLNILKKMESDGSNIQSAGGTKFRFWADDDTIADYGEDYYYATEKEFAIEKKYNGTNEVTSVNNEYNTIKLEGLYNGTYYLQEIEAREGYILNDAIVTVHVVDGKVYVNNDASHGNTVYTYTHNNYRNRVELEKIDIYDKTNITGSSAVFEVRYPDESTKTVSTNPATGKAILSGLELDGWYTITETRAPDGYWLDNTEYSFEVDRDTHKILTEGEESYSASVNIKIENVREREAGNIYLEKENEDGQLLTGARFGIYEWNKNTGRYEGIKEIVDHIDPEQILFDNNTVYLTYTKNLKSITFTNKSTDEEIVLNRTGTVASGTDDNSISEDELPNGTYDVRMVWVTNSSGATTETTEEIIIAGNGDVLNKSYNLPGMSGSSTIKITKGGTAPDSPIPVERENPKQYLVEYEPGVYKLEGISCNENNLGKFLLVETEAPDEEGGTTYAANFEREINFGEHETWRFDTEDISNATRGKLTINANEWHGYDYAIHEGYDYRGRIVVSGSIEYNTPIYVEDLPYGVYTIEIWDPSDPDDYDDGADIFATFDATHNIWTIRDYYWIDTSYGGGETVQNGPVVNEETQITFEKINTEGEVLEGGEFKVWNSEDGESAAETFVTDANGRFTVKRLPKNSTLYVQETKAPIKYAKIKEILEYEIDECGTYLGRNNIVISLTDEKGARKLIVNSIIDKKFDSYEDVSFVYDIKGIKEDDGSEIHFTMILTPNGAITDEEAAKYVTPLTTGDSKIETGAIFTLPVGQYTITQKKPQRYTLNEVVGETEDNTTVREKVVECNLVDFEYGECTFINVIDKWNGDSSASSAVNHIGGDYIDPTNGEEVSSAIMPRLTIKAPQGTDIDIEDESGNVIQTVSSIPNAGQIAFADVPYGRYKILYATPEGTTGNVWFDFTPDNKTVIITDDDDEDNSHEVHQYGKVTLDMRAGTRATIRKNGNGVPDTILDDFIVPGITDKTIWPRLTTCDLNALEYGNYTIELTSDGPEKFRKAFRFTVNKKETKLLYRYNSTNENLYVFSAR